VTHASGNFVERLTARIDKLQQQNHALGFTYGVIRKYSQDNEGRQAALLTYYGFLSLFPLLLVATSVADLIAQHNTHLRTRLLADATSYFPVVGQQLQENIHGNHATGLALVVGLLFALYGAHGIADAVRSTLDIAWGTPRTKRTKFPISMLKSFALLFGAGLGLLLTTVLAGYATSALGRSLVFRAVPIAINAALLYLIIMYVFLVGTSRRARRKDLRLGAITMVAGLLVLQIAGGYLITHELHKMGGAYGQFGLVLAILSWIYLLAQLFTYAVEVNVVHTYRLWPRTFTGNRLTTADDMANRLEKQTRTNF
jgi:membrane protein